MEPTLIHSILGCLRVGRLAEYKGLYFNDLSNVETREKFSDFVRHYNAGKLSQRFYDGIQGGVDIPRTRPASAAADRGGKAVVTAAAAMASGAARADADMEARDAARRHEKYAPYLGPFPRPRLYRQSRAARGQEDSRALPWGALTGTNGRKPGRKARRSWRRSLPRQPDARRRSKSARRDAPWRASARRARRCGRRT